MYMAIDRYYTTEMVRELNAREPRHSPRYETVHGELFVSAGPRPLHQIVVTRLIVALGNYLEREHVGQLFTSPSQISWGLPDVYVQPDVFVVPVEQARTLEWSALAPTLVVEVLSPSTARADRHAKRRLYQERRVPLYCLVDADARSVECWTSETIFPRTEREEIMWHPDGARVPFVLALAELFRAI